MSWWRDSIYLIATISPIFRDSKVCERLVHYWRCSHQVLVLCVALSLNLNVTTQNVMGMSMR